jgi:ATP-dependent Clp protease protease subunit
MRHSRTKSKQKNNDKNQEHISRVISLGYIDDKSANDVIEAIYEINLMDSSVEVEKREPIHLIINSPGGEVYDGFGIIDAILFSVTPVKATILGRAMSMALLIAAVCHYRVTGPNTRFMYHEGSYGVEGTGKVHKNELVEYDLMEKKYDDLLIEYTHITQEKIDEVKDSGKDWYFDAKQAVELGVVDHIIGEEVE